MVKTLRITNDILKCPCCGKNPLRLYGVENHKYWIECNNFDCPVNPSTRMHRIRGLDVRDWNNRKFVD